MRNGEFIKTIWRLQYAGRWYDKAPKFKDNSANHSFRVALFTLIASLIENKMFNGKIDVEKAVCRAIFHDINETVTTSINHFTKKNPEIEDIIKKFERETSEKIINLLSSSLRPYFYDYLVNAEDDSAEGRMVDAMDTFDSYLFCLRERQNGSSYYFRGKAEELEKRLREYGIKTVDWFLKQIEDKTEMEEFIGFVMNLQSVVRWAGKSSTIHDNDAMHTFRVSALAIWCGYIEKVKYGKEVDFLRLAGKCLCHDLVEAMTGDILGPIKHSSKENSEAFERYERSMNEYMVKLLPNCIQEEFTDYLVNAKDNTYEGDLVDVADKLDAIIKSLLELKRNKEEYMESYQLQLRSLQEKRTNPSVIFFLAYPIHDLMHSTIIYDSEDIRLMP